MLPFEEAYRKVLHALAEYRANTEWDAEACADVEVDHAIPFLRSILHCPGTVWDNGLSIFLTRYVQFTNDLYLSFLIEEDLVSCAELPYIADREDLFGTLARGAFPTVDALWDAFVDAAKAQPLPATLPPVARDFLKQLPGTAVFLSETQAYNLKRFLYEVAGITNTFDFAQLVRWLVASHDAVAADYNDHGVPTGELLIALEDNAVLFFHWTGVLRRQRRQLTRDVERHGYAQLGQQLGTLPVVEQLALQQTLLDEIAAYNYLHLPRDPPAPPRGAITRRRARRFPNIVYPEDAVPLQPYLSNLNGLGIGPEDALTLRWIVQQLQRDGHDIAVAPFTLTLHETVDLQYSLSGAEPLDFGGQPPPECLLVECLRTWDGEVYIHSMMVILQRDPISRRQTMVLFDPHTVLMDHPPAALALLRDAFPDYEYRALDAVCFAAYLEAPELPSTGIQQATEKPPTTGYCAIWVLYFVHLMLLNPTKPLEQLYAAMYNRPPHLLRAVIRRYRCWVTATALEALKTPQLRPATIRTRRDIAAARAEIERNLCERRPG